MGCPGVFKCFRGCRHSAMVMDYYAARDSRDEQREDAYHYQMEDEDFAQAIPIVTFRDWLKDWGMRY